MGVPDASVEVILKCAAADGELTLTDETGGSICTGTYRLADTNKETMIYDVIMEDCNGMAVVSMTAYQDKSQKPILIITLGDYSMNFFPLAE